MQNVSYGDKMELTEIKSTNYFMLLLLKEMLEVKGMKEEDRH
ncbi:MAG: hypothetical protein JWP12_1523 [Bacteroidetes bacterium]|nr:hypothetical protein [Bacteroidota bacterium]